MTGPPLLRYWKLTSMVMSTRGTSGAATFATWKANDWSHPVASHLAPGPTRMNLRVRTDCCCGARAARPATAREPENAICDRARTRATQVRTVRARAMFASFASFRSRVQVSGRSDRPADPGLAFWDPGRDILRM